MVATTAVKNSLAGALDRGAQMASNFVNEQLVSERDENTGKSFYDPLQRSNVRTMSEMNKSVKVRAKNISLSGEATYLWLLAVNATKPVPL